MSSAKDVLQKNCSMWPDFIPWEEPREVVIHQENPNSADIGLVCTAIQDPETQIYYNIAKCIGEGQPAYGHINPYEWIYDIHGKSTLGHDGIGGFSNFFRNEKNVHLLLRKATDPLKSVKTWGGQKVVSLNLKEKVANKLLHHFYCKGNTTEEIQDHILIWKTEGLKEAETSEPLHRGDELLDVNGVPVEGKKLKEILELINQQIPGKVDLKIRQIQHTQCKQDGVSKSPEFETPLSMADWSKLPENRELDNPTQLIVVEKETDPNAGGDDLSKSGGCENTPASVEPEAEGLLNPSAGTAVANQMCCHCLSSNKSRLPDNRDEWPIHKIDSSTYSAVCENLDLKLGKKPLVEALGCFSTKEVAKLQQKHSPTGGIGLSKEALGIWGNSDCTHNVSKLKKILKEDMQRIDVLQEIEEWETFSVCHRCGIRLN